MTSPAVDLVRDIPLKIEKGDYMNETGFPFDKDFDRSRDNQGRFRSQLDDIAKHIPSEFAQHFSGGFPFNSSSSRADPEFRRFTDDFPSDFEDLGFSFPNRGQPRAHKEYYPTQEEFYQQNPHQQYYQEPAQEYYQAPPQEYYQQNPEASCSKQEAPTSENQGNPTENSEKSKNNLQQSNTVDLGQQQEPVNDRSQRSMSAPPENRPRFKTSINIPMNSNAGGGDSAAGQPQGDGKQQQFQGGKPVERVIPIHIEGRDGPFVPTAPPTYTRTTNQNYVPPPEPETIFGRTFMRQEPRRGWFHDDDPFMRTRSPFQERHQQYAAPPQQRAPPQQQQQQQRAPPQQQQQQQQRAPPQQQQQRVPPKPEPQQQQQPQPQKQATPPPQPPPKPLTPLEQIEAIHKDVFQLKTQIDQFTGKTKDKNYLYLDEMLTRNMLKLDNIDTQGQDNIRTARKEAIRFVQKCADELEKKVTAKEEKQEETMEVETKTEEAQAPETMETETYDNVKPEEPIKEKSAEPMETEPPQPQTTVTEETRAVLVTDPTQTEETPATTAPPTETPDTTVSENSETQDTKTSEENKPDPEPKKEDDNKQTKKKNKKKADKKPDVCN